MSRSEQHRSESSQSRLAGNLPPGQLINVLRRAKRRSWLELTWNFPRERDCLAGFLALESAEVLAGCKPANLIRLANRNQLCGRNLYRLWLRFGPELLAGSPLRVCCCRSSDEELLLLVYRRDLLERRLASRSARTFLKRCAYPSGGLDEHLGELRKRFETQAIPHEIGLFLGYPLKDVSAFLGWTDAPFTCQSGWKIYGKAHRSLALADSHVASRSRMSDRIAQAASPARLLQA